MPKRTSSTNVSYFSRDDTGVMLSIDYDCPYCHRPTGELIFVGISGIGSIDSGLGFETDQVCGICDKAVTIEVPASLY